MTTIPQEKVIDSTPALLQDGFTFIHKRCQHHQSEIFQTRLAFQNVICMQGKEAAALFYDRSKFKREGAIPKRIQRTLMGEHGIQTLDGQEHLHRKEMFMSLMTAPSINNYIVILHEQLRLGVSRWQGKGTIVLFDEIQSLLCRVACAWAGVPVDNKEVIARARDFGSMVDGFGGIGLRHLRGKMARKRQEAWMTEIIESVRSGAIVPDEGSALHIIAFHKQLNGEYLDAQLAAVEVINLIRPIVAIATYCTFGALALHEHPECRIPMMGDEGYTEMFVQEVRRYYPFGPFLGAKVIDDFEWKGIEFKKDMLALLDIYGTNHDPRSWSYPDQFMPERFQHHDGNAFDLIPQGGGDYHSGHRCAGERITIETMKTVMIFLIRHIEYQVPPQDLTYSLSRMPTLPASKFKMTDIKSRL